MKPLLFVLSICILLISCSGQSNEKVTSTNDSKKTKIEIRRLNDTTESILFPFKFKEYNTERLKKYFILNIHIDSVDKQFEGFTSRTYKFYDNQSFMTFFVKPNDKEDLYFYLTSGSFGKDFIKLKEGFDFEMDIKNCFHKLGLNYSICDTLCLVEGDMATTFTFIFKESKLSRIDVETEQD
jgi:hypothetical protein